MSNKRDVTVLEGRFFIWVIYGTPAFNNKLLHEKNNQVKRSAVTWRIVNLVCTNGENWYSEKLFVAVLSGTQRWLTMSRRMRRCWISSLCCLTALLWRLPLWLTVRSGRTSSLPCCWRCSPQSFTISMTTSSTWGKGLGVSAFVHLFFDSHEKCESL